jgi:hypothetical protein
MWVVPYQTLTAGSIDVGNVSSNGSNVITSPRFDISLLGVLGGTTTLTDAPANLSGTTFSGGSIEVSSGVLRIPGDVRTLDGQLLTGTDGIRDDSGGNALAQLSAIGTSGSLRLLSGTLTVTGDLTNSGSIALGGGNREYGETGGTLAVPGTFTQLPGGSTSLANGLSALRAASVQIDAGGAIGSHGGIVSGPVASDGVLNASGTKVDGSYTQNADGVLEVPAISGAASLAVQGTARLGGTLAITTFAAPTRKLGHRHVVHLRHRGVQHHAARVCPEDPEHQPGGHRDATTGGDPGLERQGRHRALHRG